MLWLRVAKTVSIISIIIFELTLNPTHTPTVHQRHGQTDGRTDGETGERLTTAILRATRITKQKQNRMR